MGFWILSRLCKVKDLWDQISVSFSLMDWKKVKNIDQVLVRLNNTVKHTVLVLRRKVYLIKCYRFTGIFILSRMVNKFNECG